MKPENNNNLQFVTWNDIRTSLQPINPELSNLIDDINPAQPHPFIIADYPFGQDIVKAGDFYLPDGDRQVRLLADPNTNSDHQNALDYQKFPVGIILDKSAEVYYETHQRVIPDKLWQAGTVVGAWELLDKDTKVNTTRLSHLSSGARSIFMLPKISDRISHSRLKQTLNINALPPAHLGQHRDLFAEIIEKSTSAGQWRCRLLFFTKDWFQHLQDPAWTKFYNFIYKEAWQQSLNCRRHFERNIEWEKTLNAISKHNIYLQPQLVSHLKHIFSIADGTFPGMVFAMGDDDNVAPIEAIQQIYSDIYRLKDYAPLLMHPAHITAKQNASPIYYSLNFPSYFEPFLPTKSSPRIMSELRTIDHVMKLFQQQDQLEPVINYRMFHTTHDKSQQILPAHHLVAVDQQLEKYFATHNYEFPVNSAFFNGCMQLCVDDY